MFDGSGDTIGAQTLRTPVSDAGGILQFYSVVMNTEIQFEAFLTGYNDSFACNWSGENVFGRMDPIYTFQNTQRAITLSFTVPNVVARKDDASTPSAMMDQINRFFQFLYPKYESSNNALTIKQSPLVRVRFGNMIANTVDFSAGTAESNGLLVTVNSLSMTPKIEHGFSRLSGGDNGATLIYPNFIDLALSMNVVHEKDRFGSATMSEAAKSFPFGGFDKIAVSGEVVDVTGRDLTSPAPSTPDGYPNLDGDNFDLSFNADDTSNTDYSLYGADNDESGPDPYYGSGQPEV